MSGMLAGWLAGGALTLALVVLGSVGRSRRWFAARGREARADLGWLASPRDDDTWREGNWMEHEPTETARETTERRALAALRALWPAGGGTLTSAALVAHLAGSGAPVPAREVRLVLESFQMRGWLRLTRGEPLHAAREAHGPRTITWVNPALLER